MTTDQLLDRLVARGVLAPAQRDQLLPELAAALRDGLQRDGWAALGAVGHVRLGVQEARSLPGRDLPERVVVWYRPSRDLAREVALVPTHVARRVVAEANDVARRRWEERRDREGEGVGRG